MHIYCKQIKFSFGCLHNSRHVGVPIQKNFNSKDYFVWNTNMPFVELVPG
jgi:hypothetical protein